MWSYASSSSSDLNIYQGRRPLELSLFHKTNYWGREPIESCVAWDEFSIQEPCVWLQARPEGLGPCCHRRGCRTIEFTSQSFQQEGGGMDEDEWVLYLVRMSYHGDPYFYFYTTDVSGVYLSNRFDVGHCGATQVRSSRGDNEQHYFYKFCLCPRGMEPALRKPNGWRVWLWAAALIDYCRHQHLKHRLLLHVVFFYLLCMQSISSSRDFDAIKREYKALAEVRTFMTDILCCCVCLYFAAQVVQGSDGKGSFRIGEYAGLGGLEERIDNYMNDEGRDSDGDWIHCHIGVICNSLLQI